MYRPAKVVGRPLLVDDPEHGPPQVRGFHGARGVFGSTRMNFSLSAQPFAKPSSSFSRGTRTTSAPTATPFVDKPAATSSAYVASAAPPRVSA